jgi:hypothetical protein
VTVNVDPRALDEWEAEAAEAGWVVALRVVYRAVQRVPGVDLWACPNSNDFRHPRQASPTFST